jgi:hypothetical protein
MEEVKVSSHHDLLSIMISTVDQDQLATNEDIKDKNFVVSICWP